MMLTTSGYAPRFAKAYRAEQFGTTRRPPLPTVRVTT